MNRQLHDSNDQVCELCESDDFAFVSKRDRHGAPLETVLCRRCGLIRHAEIPSDEQLQQFYENNYREQYQGETAPGDRRVMRAWLGAERVFGRMSNRLPVNARVVEVGAGCGCTIKRFAQSGCQAWGIEPHRGYCDFGKQQLASPIKNQGLEDIGANHDHDLALLIHVVEHFNHPLRSLKQIASLLKKGGMLYIECPNLVAPFARKSKMFHFAHVHNFSPATLTSLAQRAGFELLHSFSERSSLNIELLFGFRGAASFELNPNGYEESLDALRRASGLRYYARRDYWSNRKQRLLASGVEFLKATTLVNRLRSGGNKTIETNPAAVRRVA